MRKQLYLIGMLYTLVVMSSCETTVDIEISDYVEKLVVVGEITEQAPPQITLSRTVPYNANGAIPKITDAQVTINNDLGEIIVLQWSQDEGHYSAPAEIRGVSGRSYTLHIELPDGSSYESFSELLNPVPDIDSLSAEFRINELEDYEAWYVTSYFENPSFEASYYRWKVFVNDRLLGRSEDLAFGGIEGVLKGEPIGVEVFSAQLDQGDSIGIQQLSLTKEALQFLGELAIQANTIGGPFDPPAAPIVGNIRNKDDPNDYALGYFFASSIVNKSIVIK